MVAIATRILGAISKAVTPVFPWRKSVEIQMRYSIETDADPVRYAPHSLPDDVFKRKARVSRSCLSAFYTSGFDWVQDQII